MYDRHAVIGAVEGTGRAVAKVYPSRLWKTLAWGSSADRRLPLDTSRMSPHHRVSCVYNFHIDCTNTALEGPAGLSGVD